MWKSGGNNGGGKSILQSVNGDTYLGNLANGSGTGTTFITSGNGDTYTTFLANGNVGIGTASPSTALHIARAAAVSPTLRLQTTDSTTNGSIQWSNSTNSVLAFIGSNSNISDGSGNLELGNWWYFY